MDVDLWPRDELNRYRIYRVARNGEDDLIATTPTTGGIGLALCTLSEEGEFDPDFRVGVLDSLARGPGKPGRWIVNPYR